MKITSELKTKINREFEANYEPLLTQAKKDYEQKKLEKIDNLVNDFNQMLSNHPIASSLLASCHYSNSLLENPKKCILNRDTTFFKEDYTEYTKHRQKINDHRKLEIENLYIQISYSKNLNEIKQIFSEAGLTF